MATRALIGYLDSNKVLTSTYNHYDGYPDHLGKMLDKYYDNDEKAKFIANEGYISYIDDDGNIEAKNKMNPEKTKLDGGWEDALYDMAGQIDRYGGDFAYIWYEEDGDWAVIKNTGTRSMLDQLANQLASAATMYGPVDENDVTIGDESIPMPENKKEKDLEDDSYEVDGTSVGDGKYEDEESELQKENTEEKMKRAMKMTPFLIKLQKEKELKKQKELKKENMYIDDDEFEMEMVVDRVKEIKPLFPGIDNDILVSFVKTHRQDIRGASDEDIKDEFEEFMSVNTEYVKEVGIDYSDATAGDDAIERESASGAFEESVNWRGETLKEQFKRLMN